MKRAQKQRPIQKTSALRAGGAVGNLFLRTKPNDPRVRYLTEGGFPFVCHVRTELVTLYPYVGYGNFAFACEGVRLLSAGRATKVFTLLPPRPLTFRRYLRHGVMTAVRESGVQVQIFDAARLVDAVARLKAAIGKRFAQSDRPKDLHALQPIFDAPVGRHDT